MIDLASLGVRLVDPSRAAGAGQLAFPARLR